MMKWRQVAHIYTDITLCAWFNAVYCTDTRYQINTREKKVPYTITGKGIMQCAKHKMKLLSKPNYKALKGTLFFTGKIPNQEHTGLLNTISSQNYSITRLFGTDQYIGSMPLHPRHPSLHKE